LWASTHHLDDQEVALYKSSIANRLIFEAQFLTESLPTALSALDDFGPIIENQPIDDAD
jgi:hypothetical protein